MIIENNTNEPKKFKFINGTTLETICTTNAESIGDGNKYIKDIAAVKAMAKYSVGGVSSFTDHIIDICSKPRKVPTGIPELSNAIGGGYPVSGLTIIGGVPNVGKSTIAVQSAVEMSKKGIPSLFLSFDMSGFEIMDKVHSQVSYELSGESGYTLQQIAKGASIEETEKNVELVKKIAEVGQYFTVVDMLDNDKITRLLPILDFDTTDMFLKVAKLIYRFTEIYNQPTIFIDNLQQLVGYSGLDGKQGVDRTLNFLKELARQFAVPIVLISTLGRAAYDKTIELSSFKESGNIDYAVSVAVGLEPKFITDNDTSITIDDFRESAMRDITIKCVKSRDSGFQKKYITLNAPHCTFEPFDENQPHNTSVKRQNKRTKFVDDFMGKVS